MTSKENNKGRAAVCVLAVLCVSLIVATSMICLVGNDGKVTEQERNTGTVVCVEDTVSDAVSVPQYIPVIGQENAPDADVLGVKEDEPQANGGEKFWNGLLKFEVKSDSTCKVVDYDSKIVDAVVPDIACMDGHQYIVDEIGKSALRSLTSSIRSAEIGPYVKTISGNAFTGQGFGYDEFIFKIRDIEHSKLSVIGDYAFYDSFMTSIELPASLVLIEESCFEKSNNLERVVLHSKSLKIDHKAFNNCEKLVSINLENVNRIGSEAFAGCKKLEDVNLSSAWDLRENAFKGCGLKNITFSKNIVILEDAFPGFCLSDFDNNILVKNPSNLAGKEFRKDIDNWYHQIR